MNVSATFFESRPALGTPPLPRYHPSPMSEMIVDGVMMVNNKASALAFMTLYQTAPHGAEVLFRLARHDTAPPPDTLIAISIGSKFFAFSKGNAEAMLETVAYAVEKMGDPDGNLASLVFGLRRSLIEFDQAAAQPPDPMLRA